MMNNVAKSFDILATNLSVLHNYFDGPAKLFSDLYLVKFLNTSTIKIVLFLLKSIKFLIM